MYDHELDSELHSQQLILIFRGGSSGSLKPFLARLNFYHILTYNGEWCSLSQVG